MYLLFYFWIWSICDKIDWQKNLKNIISTIYTIVSLNTIWKKLFSSTYTIRFAFCFCSAAVSESIGCMQFVILTKLIKGELAFILSFYRFLSMSLKYSISFTRIINYNISFSFQYGVFFFSSNAFHVSCDSYNQVLSIEFVSRFVCEFFLGMNVYTFCIYIYIGRYIYSGNTWLERKKRNFMVKYNKLCDF